MFFYVNNEKIVKFLSKSKITLFWGKKRFLTNSLCCFSPVFSLFWLFFSLFRRFCPLTDGKKTDMIYPIGFSRCGAAKFNIRPQWQATLAVMKGENLHHGPCSYRISGADDCGAERGR